MTTYYARVEYKYNGGDATFSIPFPYLKKEHIQVFIDDVETINYTYNTPTQIVINTNIDNGQTVSIRRNTPLDNRMVVFSDTSILNQDAQNLSANQLFYSLQEIADKFGISVDEITELASKTGVLINRADEIVNKAQESMDEVAEKVELVQQYAESVIFGLTWESFESSDWQQSGDNYILRKETTSIVVGVYQGTWSNKEKIDTVDIKFTANEIILSSIEPFDGYLLCGSSLPTSGSILPNFEEAPEEAEEGQEYFNTITKKVYRYDGTQWVEDADINDLQDQVDLLQAQLDNIVNDLSEFHTSEDDELVDVAELIQARTDNFITFTD